ncbi:MAG: hypothetical protein NTW69_07580 [Chloroflexi bacterium]|nr:hypothetical protein [Chloroflexota bacterium]
MRLRHKLPITNRGLKKGRLLLSFSLLAVLLASCQPAAATADPGIVMTAAIETAFAQINIKTVTLAPTETPIPTATVQRTPPALPPAFTIRTSRIRVSISKQNGIRITPRPARS